MKIVFLHLTMGHTNRGSEVVTDLVAQKLSRNHHVTVIQGGAKKSPHYHTVVIGDLLLDLPAAPSSFIDKALFRTYLDKMSLSVKNFTLRALPYLKKLDPDIIVVVNGFPQLKILRSHQLRAKLVVFGHAGIGYHDSDTLRARPDLFIALSHSADLWAHRLAHKNTKVIHIPNPVNLEIYQKAKPAPRFFAIPTVLVAGALTKYKNIDVVIRAVAKTGYALLVAGSGEEKDSLTALASKLFAPNRLKFLGNLDPLDLAPIFKSVDVMCFVPDSQESFGRVYLEAMCCNLPIVATNDLIRHDIIGPDGFYADPSDLDSVVTQLIQACEHGKVDYTYQLKDYLSTKVSKKIERSFRDLLTPKKSKLKIAFLHYTLGVVNRGSEISTLALATELAKTEKVLVLGSGKKTQYPFVYKQVFKLSTPPRPAPMSFWDKILFRLYLDEGSWLIRRFTLLSLNYLKRFKPDIVVATNGYPQLSILKKHYPAPKLVTFGRAGIGYHDSSALSEQADLFIALSQKAEKWAKHRKFQKTRVVMLPNPIDPRPYQKAKPIKLGLTSPAILVVSALSRYKNVDRVINALAQTPYSLILIGSGEEESSISSRLSHFPNDFRWIKSLDPGELPPYYRAATAFCFVPDPQEAFGRVYLEAMSANLPIVASDDPIRRSLIGSQGIYVNPYSSPDLVKAIHHAVSQKNQDYSAQLKLYETDSIIQRLRKELYDLF